MGISLQKGGNISLEKAAPGMTKILVGLGWDERATDGTEFDLDASIFLLGDNGKVRSDADFIFYNQLVLMILNQLFLQKYCNFYLKTLML